MAAMPASLAYPPSVADLNTDPFILSPILTLPASFGSTYVGETFSCTLCINNETTVPEPGSAGGLKRIRDVRVEAEMKAPLADAAVPLSLSTGAGAGVDLEPAETLQRLVSFQIKEKGSHVLVVTVSYYEATDTSGRARTFRKLYQFVCKPALLVRTKIGRFPPAGGPIRRWILEAQLENCGDDPVRLQSVVLEPEPGLQCQDLNWDGAAPGGCPVLNPGEVEQVCFVVSETAEPLGSPEPDDKADGRLVFGALMVEWRGSMGSFGVLSTGKLGPRPSTLESA